MDEAVWLQQYQLRWGHQSREILYRHIVVNSGVSGVTCQGGGGDHIFPADQFPV